MKNVKKLLIFTQYTTGITIYIVHTIVNNNALIVTDIYLHFHILYRFVNILYLLY